MPFYECPDCSSIVSITPALSKAKRARCRYCNLSHIDMNCLDQFAAEEMDLSGLNDDPKPVKKIKTTVVGRMAAAPTTSTWPIKSPLTMHTDVTYVADLNHVAWTGTANTCVRLPYQYLEKTLSTMQGLVISLPGLTGDAVAQAHFQACTQQMLTTNKSTDVTEATGEAAAAMAMIKHFHGFKMQWGLHCHKGAGIDQIWTLEDGMGTLTEVMIVEAKGPGAGLSDNKNMPPDFEQMSENWIIHNLATMMSGAKGSDSVTSKHQGTLAQKIVTGLGLTVGTTYPIYNGASKSYYGIISANGPQTIKVRRLLVTARWQDDGLLTFDMEKLGKLKELEPTDTQYHSNAHKNYPGMIPAKVPKINYP
jgi:hypothetical protein